VAVPPPPPAANRLPAVRHPHGATLGSVGDVAAFTTISTRRAHRRSAGVVGVLVALVLALTGCGSSSSSSGPPDLTVTGVEMHFDQPSYTLAAGNRTVVFVNAGKETHAMQFVNPQNLKVGPRNLIAPGRTITAHYHLTAGAWHIICDVPGHLEAGMISTLTVT